MAPHIDISAIRHDFVFKIFVWHRRCFMTPARAILKIALRVRDMDCLRPLSGDYAAEKFEIPIHASIAGPHRGRE